LIDNDENVLEDVFVRDRIRLEAELFGQPHDEVQFRVSGATGEFGHVVWVLLSCTGTEGIPWPGSPYRVYLTLDPCTLLALGLGPLLRAPIDANGDAQTGRIPIPSDAVGLDVYAAAVTIGASGRFMAATEPIVVEIR
jgi:hypothetical protein